MIEAWEVTEFQKDFMKIQLNFTDPLDISSSSVDKLRFRSLPSIFLESKEGKYLLQEGYFFFEVPPQIVKSDQAQLEAIGNSIERAMAGFSAGSLVFNILMASSLQLLWKMLGSI